MKRISIFKRLLILVLVFMLSINSFAAVVSDNDGATFITKAEFDSLKNNFQAQIDSYNMSIDGKIEGAIASYLAGIKLASHVELTNTWIATYKPKKISTKDERLLFLNRKIKIYYNLLVINNGNGLVPPAVSAGWDHSVYIQQPDSTAAIVCYELSLSKNEGHSGCNLAWIDNDLLMTSRGNKLDWDWSLSTAEYVGGAGQPVRLACHTVLGGDGTPSKWPLKSKAFTNFISGVGANTAYGSGTHPYERGYWHRPELLVKDTIAQSYESIKSYDILEPATNTFYLGKLDTTENALLLCEPYGLPYAGRSIKADSAGALPTGSCSSSSADWDGKWSTYLCSVLNYTDADNRFLQWADPTVTVNKTSIFNFTGTTHYVAPLYSDVCKSVVIPKLKVGNTVGINKSISSISYKSNGAKEFYGKDMDYRCGVPCFVVDANGKAKIKIKFERTDGSTVASVTPRIYLCNGSETSFNEYVIPTVTWNGGTTVTPNTVAESSEFDVKKGNLIAVNWDEALNTSSDDYTYSLVEVSGEVVSDG